MNRRFEDTPDIDLIDPESAKRNNVCESDDSDSPKSKLVSSLEKMKSQAKEEDGDDSPITGDHELRPVSEKIKTADGNRDLLEWEGEAGNSKRKPKDADSEIAKELSRYGVDGIEYVNGDVDFSPVSQYEVEFENADELYEAINQGITVEDLMSGDTVRSRGNLNGLVRNRWQKIAKQQIVDRIGEDADFAEDFQEKTGIDASDIHSVRELSMALKRNHLTLHETPDCKKIQFVPTSIHNAFKHSGGTSEMLERLIDGDTHEKRRIND